MANRFITPDGLLSSPISSQTASCWYPPSWRAAPGDLRARGQALPRAESRRRELGRNPVYGMRYRWSAAATRASPRTSGPGRTRPFCGSAPASSTSAVPPSSAQALITPGRPDRALCGFRRGLDRRKTHHFLQPLTGLVRNPLVSLAGLSDDPNREESGVPPTRMSPFLSETRSFHSLGFRTSPNRGEGGVPSDAACRLFVRNPLVSLAGLSDEP
jgi:hypothetical protein